MGDPMIFDYFLVRLFAPLRGFPNDGSRTWKIRPSPLTNPPRTRVAAQSGSIGSAAIERCLDSSPLVRQT